MEILLIFAAIIVIVIIFFVGKAKQNSEFEEKTDVKKNYMCEEKKYVPYEDEKKSIFDRYYEEFKDFDISTLNFFIESGKKSSYSDYTEDDKMKFKAQKTLIAKKRNVESKTKIQTHIQAVSINENLLNYVKNNYNAVTEIENVVRSISFNLLNSGSEYNSTWNGNIISNQNIDLNNAYKKEKDDLNEAIKLYSKIIESESTKIITYINAAERISIILGKQKMFETDYYFLSNVYNVVSESSKNNDFGFFNPSIISNRLEKTEKKLTK